MAKKDMARPDWMHTQPRKNDPPVAELQGDAKHGDKARPIIAGTSSPALKVYHSEPHKQEKPISGAYSTVDNDLARDNIENDIPAADLNEL